MIQVSLNDILNSIPVFREVSTKTLPVKTAFRVARLIRELDKENTTFDESRKQIIEKFAERDENNNMKQTDEGNIIIQQDKIDLCNIEMTDLLNMKVEINADKLNIDDFGDIEITPIQMLAMDHFIEE